MISEYVKTITLSSILDCVHCKRRYYLRNVEQQDGSKDNVFRMEHEVNKIINHELDSVRVYMLGKKKTCRYKCSLVIRGFHNFMIVIFIDLSIFYSFLFLYMI